MQNIATVVLVFGFCVAPVHAQERRIQQARELGRLEAGANQRAASLSDPASPTEGTTAGDDESFGVQRLLREAPKPYTFSAYADVSVLLTNNVGLSRESPESDAFLVPTLGLGYRHQLPYGMKVEADVSISAFRYDKFPELSFNSVDATVGLGYHAAKLGGIDFNLSYSFTNLTSESGDTFFTNHAVELSAQKTFALGDAHSAYFGVAAEIGFADPAISDRSEYSAFAGYRLQAARNWQLNVLYRYAFYDYSEGDRGDHNQMVSLGTRYRFSDWCSAYATSYYLFNRSNETGFNYDAGTLGAGVALRFSF